MKITDTEFCIRRTVTKVKIETKVSNEHGKNYEQNICKLNSNILKKKSLRVMRFSSKPKPKEAHLLQQDHTTK